MMPPFPRPTLFRGVDPTLLLLHRRRLPVVMVRLKMSETLTEAATYIEQGHVRVGPHAVTDPAVSGFSQGVGCRRVRRVLVQIYFKVKVA